jgi:hypothetical protein
MVGASCCFLLGDFRNRDCGLGLGQAFKLIHQRNLDRCAVVDRGRDKDMEDPADRSNQRFRLVMGPRWGLVRPAGKPSNAKGWPVNAGTFDVSRKGAIFFMGGACCHAQGTSRLATFWTRAFSSSLRIVSTINRTAGKSPCRDILEIPGYSGFAETSKNSLGRFQAKDPTRSIKMECRASTIARTSVANSIFSESFISIMLFILFVVFVEKGPFTVVYLLAVFGKQLEKSHKSLKFIYFLFINLLLFTLFTLVYRISGIKNRS